MVEMVDRSPFWGQPLSLEHKTLQLFVQILLLPRYGTRYSEDDINLAHALNGVERQGVRPPAER